MNVSTDHPTVWGHFFPHQQFGSGNESSDLYPHESGALEKLLLLTIAEPTTIALTVMYSLSFVMGFVGNIMSIKVLASRRSKRLPGVSATRSLLVNLAVCDLMVVCICMPVTLGHTIYTAWVYGDFLCRAVPFTQAVSVSASVLSLTVISVNRYYGVRSPLSARSFLTWRRIFWTIVVVWVVSLTICSPLIFTNQLNEVQLMEDQPFVLAICRETWPQARMKQAYNVVLFVALYCLPVTFNLTVSFLTGKKLWSASRYCSEFRDGRSQALFSTRLKTRKKIARMVVALVLLFAVSWLPLYLADIWLDYEEHPPHWILQFRPFAQWLGLTNSSLNPICYCFFGDLYRSARVIKTKYRLRFVSAFTSFASNTSGSLPKLLSSGKKAPPGHEEADCHTTDWYCPSSVREGILNGGQSLSLYNITGRRASECLSAHTGS